MTNLKPSCFEIMNEHHQAHVDAGFCPAVNRHKTWCNDVINHVGPVHSAPRVHPDRAPTNEFWVDRECMNLKRR